MDGDGGRRDVLGLKAQAAQRAFEARGMSPSKALRRALARAADALWDLALVVRSVAVESLDQDGVMRAVSDDDLLVLLDGPDGALGLAAVSRAVLTGVIEVQTIQQVTQMPVDPRPLTTTDAAMVAPLLDDALARFAENLGEHPLRPHLDGYRFGAMIEDTRAAAHLLNAAGYHAFRAEADLALGRRSGDLLFVLPEAQVTFRHSGSDPEAPGPHAEMLERVPVRLEAVLARIRMTLGEAEALKPGDLLDLPPDALDKVDLLAAGGQLAARGRLGQMHGARAVRLNWPAIGPGARAAAAPIAGFEAAAPEPQAAAPLAVASQAPPPAPEEEALPDLPPLDFASEAADFDFGTDGGEGGFDAAPLDIAVD